MCPAEFFSARSCGVMAVAQVRTSSQLQLVLQKLWAKLFLLLMESLLVWPSVCQSPMYLLWILQ
jgi:hypothetical protein